jgi:hypothetical protein
VLSFLDSTRRQVKVEIDGEEKELDAQVTFNITLIARDLPSRRALLIVLNRAARKPRRPPRRIARRRTKRRNRSRSVASSDGTRPALCIMK